MPITLIGTFEKLDKFKGGDCILKFSIPMSHMQQASDVSNLLERVLIIQVYEPHEAKEIVEGD